jgi:hypothetical protein
VAILTAGIVILAGMVWQSNPITRPVQAQPLSTNLYIEPGTVSIRNPDGGGTIGDGKMVVDLKTGDVWGFPTNLTGSPYPVDPINKTPPISKPVYLGRFDFSQMRTR